ncbi:hypothetical protein MKEN_01437100 [Mycena kentingensis (nom. inval.)]|nr:hypothetical protein MKEN_01437100 [Mycena kentingensis (nom. inval.)]
MTFSPSSKSATIWKGRTQSIEVKSVPFVFDTKYNAYCRLQEPVSWCYDPLARLAEQDARADIQREAEDDFSDLFSTEDNHPESSVQDALLPDHSAADLGTAPTAEISSTSTELPSSPFEDPLRESAPYTCTPTPERTFLPLGPVNAVPPSSLRFVAPADQSRQWHGRGVPARMTIEASSLRDEEPAGYSRGVPARMTVEASSLYEDAPSLAADSLTSPRRSQRISTSADNTARDEWLSAPAKYRRQYGLSFEKPEAAGTTLVLDRRDVVTAAVVQAPSGDGGAWRHVNLEIAQLLDTLRQDAAFRFGRPLRWGMDYQAPGWRVDPYPKRVGAPVGPPKVPRYNLANNGVLRKIIAFQNDVVEQFFPELHSALAVRMELLKTKNGYRGAYSNSVFSTCEVRYLDPRESEEMLERKEWQVPFADPFVVTVVGNWDPRRGGHLMLHDDGTMMPLRPGATFVVPAGTKRYGFVPVGEGEHQYMVCQFFHGSVLRWMEKGGMSDPRLDTLALRMDPAALRKWKAYEKIQARRRVLAKRIFSTISDVYSGSFLNLVHDLAAVVRRNGHFPTTAGSGGMTAGDTVVAESVAELEERLLATRSTSTTTPRVLASDVFLLRATDALSVRQFLQHQISAIPPSTQSPPHRAIGGRYRGRRTRPALSSLDLGRRFLQRPRLAHPPLPGTKALSPLRKTAAVWNLDRLRPTYRAGVPFCPGNVAGNDHQHHPVLAAPSPRTIACRGRGLLAAIESFSTRWFRYNLKGQPNLFVSFKNIPTTNNQHSPALPAPSPRAMSRSLNAFYFDVKTSIAPFSPAPSPRGDVALVQRVLLTAIATRFSTTKNRNPFTLANRSLAWLRGNPEKCELCLSPAPFYYIERDGTEAVFAVFVDCPHSPATHSNKTNKAVATELENRAHERLFPSANLRPCVGNLVIVKLRDMRKNLPFEVYPHESIETHFPIVDLGADDDERRCACASTIPWNPDDSDNEQSGGMLEGESDSDGEDADEGSDSDAQVTESETDNGDDEDQGVDEAGSEAGCESEDEECETVAEALEEGNGAF